MITKNNKVKIIDLGLKSFLSSWEYQDQLFDSIISVKVSNRKNKKKSLTNNYMVFVEHPAVYTLGNSGKIENLLVGFSNMKIDRFNEGDFPRKLFIVQNQKK